MPQPVVSLDMAATGVVEVVTLSGREAMSSLTSWEAQILIQDPVDEKDLVQKTATLRLADEVEGSERQIPLVVTSAERKYEPRFGHRYELVLAPPSSLFSQRRAHRVWVDKTTQDIVKEVLATSGITLKWRLTTAYMRRLQCVQYGETDWEFLERLLAEEGIAYWWASSDAGVELYFADDPGAHDGIDDGPVFFRDAEGMVGESCFFELDSTFQVTSTAAHLVDYDVRQPKVPIEGKAGKGLLEIYEFPANVLTGAAATSRAKARVDQYRRDEHRLIARGVSMRPHPGRWLEIAGATDDDANGKLLVVSIEHEYAAPTPSDARPRPYVNRVVMVPLDNRTYRPAGPRTAPRVSELEVAMTTGPGGEEIHVDDLGRVKIRMFWDRSGITDDKSSAWVRCLQLGMGGSMILPRVGWEVPVAFAYGNPDMPIVLGRTYNANAVVPYGLPAAAMKTTLQSATSPGGGGTNEIRMDDSGGKQEVFVHASRDQTVRAGGNSTTKIGNNETYDVGLSHSIGVKGSHTHTVGSSQKVAVGTEHFLKVKGSRTETVGAMERIDVTGNLGVVSKSSYGETIGAMHGLECNQANTNVKGMFSQTVGGTMSITGGLSVGENVAAARSEEVGGARIIDAGHYAENVSGAKTVTAGASSDKAAGDLITKVKGDAKVTSASMKLSSGGPFVFKATEVSFEISGALEAGALKLAGGTMKASKGTTKLKGTIKRQGETKIE